MSELRAFLAVELNYKVKNEIFKIQDKLRKMNIKGRYTYKDNFHITIKFLGNINNTEVDNIRLILKDKISLVDTFNISLDKIGYFKGKSNKETEGIYARVLWISLNDEYSSLSKLNSIVDESLSEQGYDREYKPFKPHITLARDIILSEHVINNIILPPEKSIVDKVIMFKSELIDNKRKYIPLWNIDLKK